MEEMTRDQMIDELSLVLKDDVPSMEFMSDEELHALYKKYCLVASTPFRPRVTVYHGSTTLFTLIDTSKGKPYKDFGRGFYLSRNMMHAKTLALRNQKFDSKREGRSVSAYLYTYELDLMAARSVCSIKEFESADLHWLDFILSNRRVRDRTHNYDIVLGPTADDDTSLVLKAYFDGIYGEVGSLSAKETALRLLEADNLPPQIYFATNSATKFLTQIGGAKVL